MFREEAWLEIGEIVAPHGLDGKLRVNPSTDFPERFTEPGERWIQQKKEEPRTIHLLHGKQIPGKSIYVIALKGINDRNSAESIVRSKILIPSHQRPKLKKNEFHYLDLIGLEVRLNSSGPSIGTVKDLRKGGNDLLEIELLEGRKILIPFVHEIVPDIKIRDGWLKISPPPGLLNLEIVD